MKKYIVYTLSLIATLLLMSSAVEAAPPGLGLSNNFFGGGNQPPTLDAAQDPDPVADPEDDPEADPEDDPEADSDTDQNPNQDPASDGLLGQSPSPAPKSGSVKISKLKATPTKFNPVKGEETEILYKVSGESKIEIQIVDEANVEILKLVDDENAVAGQEYTIKWNGTDKKDSLGKVIAPGTYFIKATAKNKITSAVLIAKTTKITISSASSTSKSTGKSVSVLHNSPPKETSGTGPEAAIYLAFPVIGYFVTKYGRR